MGMRRKTIKAILAKKFKAFLDHVPNENIRKQIQENSIITGGAIASMLLGEDINDLDIYFRSKEVARDVARYYVDWFLREPPARFAVEARDKRGIDAGVEEVGDRVMIRVKYYSFDPDPEEEDVVKTVETAEVAADVVAEKKEEKKPKYRPIFLSPNCISLANDVQLIVRFYGTPDDIHANYDFVHCTNYWTSWDNELVLREEALESLLAKELRYVGSKYPICSMMRVRKFLLRGWKINAGQIVKMAWQIHNLKLDDPLVLEDQLVGVDTAYFQQLIEELKKNCIGKVEGAYLFQLIDSIF
jgi:hypothetical protein